MTAPTLTPVLRATALALGALLVVAACDGDAQGPGDAPPPVSDVADTGLPDGAAGDPGLDAGEEVAACVPACEGKTCGEDGCGGSCGGCPEHQACGPDGQCACAAGYQGPGCGACADGHAGFPDCHLDAVQVAASENHTCAVLAGGGIRCWGYNRQGQLGDGSTTDRTTPVEVVGLGARAIQVSTGTSHTCALLDGGAVRCWGDGRCGALGDGVVDMADCPVNGLPGPATPTPVDVASLGSGVVSISVGYRHSCAVLGSGAVGCWGVNGDGQLGDGTTSIGSSTPVEVVGLPGPAVAVSSGYAHTCAMLADGAMACWGSNIHGQIGNGTTEPVSGPVPVASLGSGVSAIATGDWHTCAAMKAGGVQCWGWNVAGSLGHPGWISGLTPYAVNGIDAEVTALTTRDDTNCALLKTGGLECWGGNEFGQIGDGTFGIGGRHVTPVPVTGPGGSVRSVSCGREHTCAVLDDGRVRCWGSNEHGQLGNGIAHTEPVPVAVSGLDGTIRQVSAGATHTCALSAGGRVKCWGNNDYGAVGNGTLDHKTLPTPVVDLDSQVSMVAAGTDMTCALRFDGSVRCWGFDYYDEPDEGIRCDSAVEIPGLDGGMGAVTAGEDFACALGTSGDVRCWGENDYGQLGDGTWGEDAARDTPAAVSGLDGVVRKVVAKGSTTCAWMLDDRVLCWGWVGAADDPCVRYMDDPVDSLPRPITVLPDGVADVDATGGTLCVLMEDGRVKCLGCNARGRLGDGTGASSNVLVDVAGLRGPAVAISVGQIHACALLEDGGVQCWGYNLKGALGDGTTTDRGTAVLVKGLSGGATGISAGLGHTCATLKQGGAACWGDNFWGQLGNGRASWIAVPTDVAN